MSETDNLIQVEFSIDLRYAVMSMIAEDGFVGACAQLEAWGDLPSWHISALLRWARRKRQEAAVAMYREKV